MSRLGRIPGFVSGQVLYARELNALADAIARGGVRGGRGIEVRPITGGIEIGLAAELLYPVERVRVTEASHTAPAPANQITYGLTIARTGAVVESVGWDRRWEPWIEDGANQVVPAAVGSIGMVFRTADAEGRPEAVYMLEERPARKVCGA